MIEDLIDYHEEDIAGAFLAWRRSKSKIPTPAEIRKLCEKKMADRHNKESNYAIRKLIDFGGDWEEYKKHLEERNNGE